jgi:hypothetical protein
MGNRFLGRGRIHLGIEAEILSEDYHRKKLGVFANGSVQPRVSRESVSSNPIARAVFIRLLSLTTASPSNRP